MKVGRNDPCPCGSGLKYKKCCLLKKTSIDESIMKSYLKKHGIRLKNKDDINAIKKAGRNAQNALLVSDAFIPKTDNVKIAARAGIKAIIQTGGSIADPAVIKEADKSGIVMVMTGSRHFKH